MWAASFTVQAAAYANEPLTTAVLIARGGIPGFICGWLLWRGGELRRIAAVLLISWPLSYLIYALPRDDSSSAFGELVISVPTILVGCRLWRERNAAALSYTGSGAAARTADEPSA